MPLRLDVSNREAQQLLSAAGARRYAYNWALARVVANHAHWQAEASYGIEKRDRVKPFSFFDLVKQWDVAKHAHTATRRSPRTGARRSVAWHVRTRS